MARRYWLCKCGHRNARTASRRCGGCHELTKPTPRTRKHKLVLRQTPYKDFAILSVLIHGGEPHHCGVCGKPPPERESGQGRHDRDHDHKTGKPRGIACGGNQGCNILMLPWITAPVAAAIATAKVKNGELDAHRWVMIARYLGRVEAFYAKVDVA